LVESLLTVALAVPVAPTCNGETGGDRDTEMVGAEIVMTALTACVLLAWEVAVIVTVPPGGAELGAVKTVGAPLGVWIRLKEPHDELPQVTLHRAPRFWTSLVTVATRLVWLLGAREVGGSGAEKAMAMGGPFRATVTVTFLLRSAVDTAVTLTEFPVGSAVGAINVVGLPLAVCAGLNEPHLADSQLTCQSSPMFIESFTTVAITGVIDATCRGEGGAWLNSTSIVLGLL
jgi:hypothetical protein